MVSHRTGQWMLDFKRVGTCQSSAGTDHMLECDSHDRIAAHPYWGPEPSSQPSHRTVLSRSYLEF